MSTLLVLVLVLAVEEELVPQEKLGQALEVDLLELSLQPQVQMAVMSDQAAGYYLPLRALGYSLAWSLGA